MNLIGVESYYQTIVKGLLIIGAVMLDMTINKKEADVRVASFKKNQSNDPTILPREG
jgi:hypothetical protein